MASNVPITVQGSYGTSYTGPTMVIGSTWSYPSSYPENNYWLAVVDLTNLQVVANELTANDVVPSDVQQYAGNPQYFLIAASVSSYIDNVPQGALYTLLTSVGAGPMLARLEQINEQTNSSVVGQFSYVLATTMAEDDQVGFEELSFNYCPVMTFQFMPVTVGGNTIYAPIQTGS